jgi:hypothetical protein
MPESTTDKTVDPDTPIYGAAAISKIVNLTPRQTVYCLELGHLPATKVGARWATTPRRLLNFINGKSE